MFFNTHNRVGSDFRVLGIVFDTQEGVGRGVDTRAFPNVYRV